MFDARGLARLRRAWRCDCDGVSHETPGRVDDGAVEGWVRDVRHFAGGERCTSCPWRIYEDPDVIAVLRLFSECRTDNGCTPALIQWDVPAIHWDGLLYYRSCLDRVSRRMREDEERARAKPPPRG